VSTKITIIRKDNYHLYKECFDDDSIYISIDDAESKIETISKEGKIHTTTVIRLSSDMIEEISSSYKIFKEDEELSNNKEEDWSFLFRN